MNQVDQPGATRWGLVLAIFGAGVTAAFQVGKTPPSLPLIRPDLNLSLVAAGWVISILNLVGALTGLLSGRVADILGHRRVLLAGLCCLALGSLLGGVAPRGGVLLFSRFVEGVGYILVVVSAPALIIGLTHPRNTRQAIGLWAAFMPTGTGLMMLLSPLALETVGWRGLWVANGCLVVSYGLFLAWLTSRREGFAAPVRTGRPPLLAGIGKILSRPGPALLGVAFTAYALQFMAVVGFLPTLLIEELGLGGSRAAVLTALVAFVNAPGNLAGGWLLQKGVRRAVLLVLAGLTLALCGLGIYSDGLGGFWRYLLCLVFSAVGGIYPASLIAGSQLHAPEPALVGTTNGLVMQGGSIGSLIGPPLLATAVSLAGGWSGGSWVLAGAATLTVILGLILGLVEARMEN